VPAHEEHQFLFDKDPDGKEKSPFADFKYTPEVLKDKEKQQPHADWNVPDEIDPLVAEENYGEELPVIFFLNSY